MNRRAFAGLAILMLPVLSGPAAGHELRVNAWLHARNYYAHNYGPGPWPGTVVTYDGPTRALCKQGAAAYRGQDGRRHPCY